MENVLNNLLLLIESNCNEGTYIKASNLIKEVYDIQPEEVIILKKEIEELNEERRDFVHYYEFYKNLDNEFQQKQDRDKEKIIELNDIIKIKTTEFNEYKKKSIEKEMELLQEIRELNKELRNKSNN